jgi:hypothetical protein
VHAILVIDASRLLCIATVQSSVKTEVLECDPESILEDKMLVYYGKEAVHEISLKRKSENEFYAIKEFKFDGRIHVANIKVKLTPQGVSVWKLIFGVEAFFGLLSSCILSVTFCIILVRCIKSKKMLVDDFSV